jgi:hypothetical protein
VWIDLLVVEELQHDGRLAASGRRLEMDKPRIEAALEQRAQSPGDVHALPKRRRWAPCATPLGFALNCLPVRHAMTV